MVRRNPVVLETELDGEMVLLDPATRAVFTLNHTGVLVWRRLDEGIDAAVETLVREYGISEAIARADVERLVAQLQESGLVVD